MTTKNIVISAVITAICLVILLLLVPVEKKQQLEKKWGELAILAETDERAQYIIDNEELYPDELLREYYQKNERFDFVYNYPFLKDKYPVIEFTDAELNSEDVPALYMADERWCYNKVGDYYIYTDGCATVCLTMANLYLNNNNSVDPRKVAEYVNANNYTSGIAGGILADKLPVIFDHFGFSYTEHLYDPWSNVFVTEEELKAVLDKEDTVVYIGVDGDTFGSHAMILRGYDENGFYVNDPENPDKTAQVWNYEVFKNELFLMYELYAK